MFWHRFQKIDSLMKPLTRHALKSHHYLIAQIYMHWKDIVGAHFEKIAKPEKILIKNNNAPGIIYLKVAHSAYVMEIRFHEKMIIEKINSFLGQKAIEKINYVHHLQKASSQQAKGLHCAKSAQSSVESIKKHVEDILDEDLQKALFSLGNAIIHDKKN